MFIHCQLKNGKKFLLNPAHIIDATFTPYAHHSGIDEENNDKPYEYDTIPELSIETTGTDSKQRETVYGGEEVTYSAEVFTLTFKGDDAVNIWNKLITASFGNTEHAQGLRE